MYGLDPLDEVVDIPEGLRDLLSGEVLFSGLNRRSGDHRQQGQRSGDDLLLHGCGKGGEVAVVVGP